MKIKRHNNIDGEGPSRKHFVSEEAVAARFTCLSLSNDHVYGSNGFPVTKGQHRADGDRWSQDEEPRMALGGEQCSPDSAERTNVIVEGMFDMSDSRVIVVSPDLQRRLQSPPEDILPRCVLHAMSHPCMELILWQPPGNVIQRALRMEGKQRGRVGRPRTGDKHPAEDKMEL